MTTTGADKKTDAELIERATKKAVAWANGTISLTPLLAELRAVVERFGAGRAEVDAATRAFPDRAKIWLGPHFVHEVYEKFSALLLLEAQAVASGKPSPTNFSKSVTNLFASVEKRLDTVAATIAGSKPGRKIYRASDGAISGLSGGLTVRDGDELALLVDDPETKRLVASGNLILVEGK